MVNYNSIWEMLKKRYDGMVRFKALWDENMKAFFVPDDEVTHRLTSSNFSVFTVFERIR